jgi:ATP-grasp domain, R2K clade family 2
MPTLILPPRFTDDTQRMWRAAVSAGWIVERLPNWRAEMNFSDPDLVLYGEPLFAAVVADKLGLALVEPPQDWVARLPDEYRQRSVRMGTLDEARGIDSPVFIKPADDKCFTARVYTSGAELPSADVLDGCTPVLIAEPVHWQVEYRCFVLDQRVVAWSPYLRDGELAQAADGTWSAPQIEADEAIDFARAALSDSRVQLPPAVVLDVGIIRSRGWAVVEANAAWGSGIYGCDANEALKVIQRSCVPRNRLTASDAKWVIQRKERESMS